jgi:hypothetical protein
MPPDPPPARRVVKRDKTIAERYSGPAIRLPRGRALGAKPDQDYLNAKVNTRSAPVLWTPSHTGCR